MQGLNIRVALVAGMAFGLTAGAAMAQEKSITVAMTGGAAGDADGTGTAVVKIDQAKNQVCYTLNVAKIGTATAAHIHKAAAGASGPPVVPLTAPNAAGTSEGCATVTHDLAMALAGSPADYYVNVHNAEFPGGAVRGQLH